MVLDFFDHRDDHFIDPPVNDKEETITVFAAICKNVAEFIRSLNVLLRTLIGTRSGFKKHILPA